MLFRSFVLLYRYYTPLRGYFPTLLAVFCPLHPPELIQEPRIRKYVHDRRMETV